MFATMRGIGGTVALLSVLVSACDHRSSPLVPSPSPRSTPEPLPQPVMEVWQLTAHLTSVNGGECVGDTMHSQMGVSKRYSLEVTRTGATVYASILSASGDYVCWLTEGRAEGDGFSFGPSGWYWCDIGGVVREYVCANGERRDLSPVGHTLYGRVSGDAITGSWGSTWEVTPSIEPSWEELLETTTEFSGSR